ncbi:hypothetical protein [Nocardioides alcanivorans]|uniref:hypothetical protein n=1 Tax=Nocardioides alcanivorans TaxID=2897352 RepID=UPI001F487B59|nr:hypothetical protein [Nocardioides alcanivorans]
MDLAALSLEDHVQAVVPHQFVEQVVITAERGVFQGGGRVAVLVEPQRRPNMLPTGRLGIVVLQGRHQEAAQHAVIAMP